MSSWLKKLRNFSCESEKSCSNSSSNNSFSITSFLQSTWKRCRCSPPTTRRLIHGKFRASSILGRSLSQNWKSSSNSSCRWNQISWELRNSNKIFWLIQTCISLTRRKAQFEKRSWRRRRKRRSKSGFKALKSPSRPLINARVVKGHLPQKPSSLQRHNKTIQKQRG